ncbi:Trihelix transcription factor ASIL2 [Heracleum sosnowskyi]|uniref:Trihelix transcription factor ASIL2 n=1 Tax=Heracleum sosnowskyi TaxID=360622 RepID=A0AAD8MF69_9APIA|nr:Trihelix transcription factor ASIL2 [Heracleum sosnowskyi]
MDRETKQESSPHHPNQTIHTATNDSNRKQAGSGGGSINDRIKRDEWSEGAVSSLLEAYETKWVHRNRAKLKGQDWEEVAKFVSSRGNSTKSPKTQTQCKNKIESMKKRYRSESAAGESSSWPLFPRLDHLLRVSGTPHRTPLLPQPQPLSSTLMMQEPSLPLASQALPLPKQTLPLLTTPCLASPINTRVAAEMSNGSNGADPTAKEDGMCRKLCSHESDKKAMETDSSTPAICSDKEKTKSEKLTRKAQRNKKRRREEWEIGDSVRWFAEVVVRTEQARLDAMRDLERMRAESEAKRGEMELQRTEIIANTHLEIARIFAGKWKGDDSSLRIQKSG